MPPEDIHDRLLIAVSNFQGFGEWIDKLSLAAMDKALAASTRSARCSIACNGTQWLVRYDVPARTWSLGELMVLTASLARGTIHPDYWRVITIRLMRTVQLRLRDLGWLDKRRAQPWLRDAMHVAHGLACALPIHTR
ncbi:MAG: hypothetical protein GVY16_11250 [Planctomycetes bacterium]|jgi:hypothetical protein|nr:hypothetical protein [Planctomycetota bacterium]